MKVWKVAKQKQRSKTALEVVEGRGGEDTVRVWERYRQRGHLWRGIALIQVPINIIALVVLLSNYFSADTIVEIPERPQPGHYSVKKLPDSEFINVASEVINLVQTYTPATAKKQFRTARRFLWEPALSQFEQQVMENDTRMIEETGRSQVFFVDPEQTKVQRRPDLDTVVVRLMGDRQKLIGSKPLPPDKMAAYVKMTTIPRNVHNEFGIVVTDMRLEYQSGAGSEELSPYRGAGEPPPAPSPAAVQKK